MDPTSMFKIAVQSGQWKAVSDFLDDLHGDEYLPWFSVRIVSTGGTILHAAVIAQKESIIEKLVNKMSVYDLAIQDDKGYTALHETTHGGNSRMAECLFTKNNSLIKIKSFSNDLPVVMAMRFGHKELASYLYRLTPLDDLEAEEGHQGSALLTYAIYARHFDLTLSLMELCPRLAFVLPQENLSPLNALAAFPSSTKQHFGLSRSIWKLWRNHNLLAQGKTVFMRLREMETEKAFFRQVLPSISNNIQRLNPNVDSISSSIFYAISRGNFEFVFHMLKANSELLWIHNSEGMNIFQYAILHRQAKIFSLAYGLKGRVEALLAERDRSGNTILHLAGMLTGQASIVQMRSPAFQMQRELLWFEEVENICQPFIMEVQNHEGLTPIQVFRMNHQNLREAGEKWMKDATNSGLVAATLIVTVMFTAIFTYPGGNEGNTGLPILVNDVNFKLFMVIVSGTIYCSSTSMIMFLGIFTSRYAEEDFKSLSRSMRFGYMTLSLSILTMLLGFWAALGLVLRWQLSIVIPIAVLMFLFIPFPDFMGTLIGSADIKASSPEADIFDRNMKRLF